VKVFGGMTMTIFACFGPMFSTEFLLMILGITLGIEAILIGGIAFLISAALSVPMRKILGAGAVMLLGCGAVSLSLEWEGAAALTLSSAVVCGCLLAVGWLIKLIRGERKAGEEDFRRSLIFDTRSTIESGN
jgi:hypothetical protein